MQVVRVSSHLFCHCYHNVAGMLRNSGCHSANSVCVLRVVRMQASIARPKWQGLLTDKSSQRAYVCSGYSMWSLCIPRTPYVQCWRAREVAKGGCAKGLNFATPAQVHHCQHWIHGVRGRRIVVLSASVACSWWDFVREGCCELLSFNRRDFFVVV